MGQLRVTSTVKQWEKQTEQKLDVSMLQAATDIHRVSGMLAPIAKGTLVKSGKIRRVKPGHYEVSYGGGAVRYAKRRHFENLKHPGTLHYLERAGDATAKAFSRYLRGARA